MIRIDIMAMIKLLKTKNKYDIFRVDQCENKATLMQGDVNGQVIINLAAPYAMPIKTGYHFYNKDADSIFYQERSTLASRRDAMTFDEYKDLLPESDSRYCTVYLDELKSIIKACEPVLKATVKDRNSLHYLALRGDYCYACDGNMVVRMANPVPALNDFLLDIDKLKQYVKVLNAMKIKQTRAWQDKEGRLIFESVGKEVYLILNKSNLKYPDIEKLIKKDLDVHAKVDAIELHKNIDNLAAANISKTEILAFTKSINQLKVENTNCQINPCSYTSNPRNVSDINSDTCSAMEIYHYSSKPFNTFYLNNTFYGRLKAIFPKNHVVRMDWGDRALSPKYFYNDCRLVLIMPSQFKGQAN